MGCSRRSATTMPRQKLPPHSTRAGMVRTVTTLGSTAASMALQEVTKTVMMTNHGAANYAILVPTKYYTELPADVQEAFDKAATECGTWLADQVEQQDADALKVFEDAGCKIVYPDYSAWETAAYGSYAEMYPELAKYATAMKEAAHS